MAADDESPYRAALGEPRGPVNESLPPDNL